MMKGIFLALALLAISLILGQIFDQIIDNTIETSSGPLRIPLYALKILIGLPTDIPQWILKIFVLAGIAVGGEAS